MTTISVALCTYNSQAFLADQLESIASQTTPVDELVVADDGSTDGTLTIVADFATTHAGVVVLQGPPAGGVAKNFARALSATTGDVVFLSDHDDAWSPVKVERLASQLDASTPHLVFTDARLIDAEGLPTGTSLFASLRLSKGERALIDAGSGLEVLVRRNVVTGATAAVTRPLIDLALPIPAGWIHDEWLAAVGALRGTITLVDEPLTDYRIHGANQIGVGSPSPLARVRRMFASSPDRHARALERFTALHERAIALGASPNDLELLAGKVAFEAERSRFSPRRWRRVARISRLLASGQYSRFASQGVVDAARDLLVA